MLHLFGSALLLAAAAAFPPVTEKMLYRYSEVDSTGDLILPPPAGKIGEPVAMVFAQGASIDPVLYQPLAEAIQREAEFPIYFAGVKCVGGVCAVPTTLSSGVDRVLTQLQTQGLPANSKVVFGGHSLGGAMMPGYVKSAMTNRTLGMVLMGAFLTRDFKTGKTAEGRPQYVFPTPTLTIGGELDGLCRMPRIAEALYSQVSFSADPVAARKSLPVTVVPGMSHQQIASGTPTSMVAANDLTPEITDAQAKAALASDTVNFIRGLREGDSSPSWAAIARRVDASEKFVAPMVDAFNMEGYGNFLPPCLCETLDEYGFPLHGTCVSQPNCTGGAPWTAHAQQIFAGDAIKVASVDSLHFVNEERPSPHLPHIHGNPDAQATPGAQGIPPLCRTPLGCTLNVTTVTQNLPPKSLPGTLGDTGFYPVSAQELRTKMMSRQALWEAAGIADVNFTQSDGLVAKGGLVDLCAAVNQAALDWAAARASPTARARFAKHGQPMKIIADKSTCAAGPCWINAALKYDNQPANNVVTIQSTSFPTKNEKPFYPCGEGGLLPCDSGFHYCKFLSPARALEWMLVDGLKLNYGIKPKATEQVRSGLW